VVDDHPIMIDGIIALLSESTKFKIVAETSFPDKVLEMIRNQPVEILITDISMPKITGLELTKMVKSQFPEVKVLALSMHGDRQTISEMLEAGISGYVLKNTGKTELVEALERISGGGMFFSQDVSTELLKPNVQSKLQVLEAEVKLTSRELEIVQLIANELSNAQIGEKLFISERTVETHRKNIFHKTKTKSVAGLVRFAIETGIVK
jgi:DNA-binding NarL/FixJ family response regulator